MGRPTAQQEPIIKFFSTAHLTREVAAVSKPFGDLAGEVIRTLPPGDERRFCLRWLLMAKDCAVRSFIGAQPP